MPGTRGKRLSARIATRVAPPTASDTRLVLPSTIPRAIAHMSRSGPVDSIEKPSSFGVWLSSTVSAMPFM
jgi:hypothetical protein